MNLGRARVSSLRDVCCDKSESLKVLDIERQNFRDGMSLHRRDKSRIVRILSDDTVTGHELLPMIEDCAFVSENMKQSAELSDICLSLGSSHSKSILLTRPRGDYPILVEDLRHQAQFVTLLTQC
jgi:hypothetical protein